MEALEMACAALHAPPTGPESEIHRGVAGLVLERFKRSPNALVNAMNILRNNLTPPVVQFHCITTIREVTLQRWLELALQEKSNVLDFLMQFLLEHSTTLPRFVEAAALQTVVLLVKRGWLDRLESERVTVLQQMGIMLQPGKAPFHRLLAARWLLAFVTEFSTASRASNMMLPIEFHTTSRRTLEKSGSLKDIVALAVPLLEDSIRSTTTARRDATGDISSEQLELLNTAYQLCGELLNWQFEDPRASTLTWSLNSLTDEDATGNCTVLTPQASWRPILVRPELIHSSFNTYVFFRNVAPKNETLLHLARQFLLQLASLQGPIFERKIEQVQFLSEIFRGVVTIVQNPFLDLLTFSDSVGYDLATREMIDCCQLLFRLVTNIGLDALLQAASSQLFSSFVQELALLTRKLLLSALARCQRHLRENSNETIHDLWELDGVDILLDAWVALANSPQLLEAGLSGKYTPDAEQALTLLSEVSASIVELYLQVQMELCAVEVLTEQDEDKDVEDNAASSTQEQYDLAAALARLNPYASASLLVSLLQSLITEIQQELANLQGRDEMTITLSQLFEKLYFIILFSGLFLADDFKGERPGIPSRIGVHLRSIASAEESSVVNLIVLILNHVLEFETLRLAHNPTSICVSPFVSEGLIETITRLCATYLAPDILCHAVKVAPVLLQVFGSQDRDCGSELLRLVIQRAMAYLLHWPTEPVVMEKVIEFVLLLSTTRAITSILQMETWKSLVQANASAGPFIVAIDGKASTLDAAVARIPSNLRGNLTEALCRAGMTAADQNMREAHFQAVSRPIAQRLQQLISMSNFESRQTANDARMQEELKLLVEMYSGIARSAESTSHARITSFCLPALPVLVKVFQIFQNDSQIVNCILNFFCLMVEAQLCYLPPRDALQVYLASDNLIHTYCRHNLGKKSTLGDAEEENYIDLLALLTLLSRLVAKDFIDFSEDATSDTEQADATHASSVVADVVFSGMRKIIPLMTEELLAYPSLSKQYFTLVSYMVDVYAEKLASLPSELFQMLLRSLLIGQRHVSTDVVRNSFQALGELATYHWKALRNQKSGLEAHRQQHPDMFLSFLRVIIHTVLLEDFNPVVLDTCAGALYPLLLIEQSRYQSLAEEICCLQAILDAGKQQRLAAAFTELIRFVTPADIATDTATTRKMRMQFKANLYAFVAEVRGFLQVK